MSRRWKDERMGGHVFAQASRGPGAQSVDEDFMSFFSRTDGLTLIHIGYEDGEIQETPEQRKCLSHLYTR